MKKPKVTIIDYGLGNLLSVQMAVSYCGGEVHISSDEDQILSSEKVILPGVGAFPNAMKALQDLKLVEVIKKVAIMDIPLLGICLGMQLLFDESEEFGITRGLGLIPGRVSSIPAQSPSGVWLKSPHIGWGTLNKSHNETSWERTVLESYKINDSVYFVHSFMVTPEKNSNRLADVDYGGQKIAAVVKSDNIIGCQFHPEKSGEVGLKIIRNFISQ